jgi:hypothetical protein
MGRREKGEGRREKGEGRREKGEGRGRMRKMCSDFVVVDDFSWQMFREKDPARRRHDNPDDH